jgi:EamA-like transporter family
MTALSSLAFLAPAAVNLPRHLPPTSSILALAALGIINTGVAYWLFYLLIDQAGPATASVITYVMPVVALFLGVGLLGELGDHLRDARRRPLPGRRLARRTTHQWRHRRAAPDRPGRLAGDKPASTEHNRRPAKFAQLGLRAAKFKLAWGVVRPGWDKGAVPTRARQRLTARPALLSARPRLIARPG